MAVVEIRPALASDADALSGLIRGLGFFARLEGEDATSTAARVDRHLSMCLADDSHTVFVAVETGGHIVGYTAVHWLPYLFLTGPEGYLSELFVADDRRSRGVGTELLERVIDEARRRGCARLMLAAVRSRESYERGFYTARGWVEREDVANLVYELEPRTGS